jgi:hypothetical protein
MERKQIQLTSQQAAAVHRIATRRKTSDAAVVREAVDLWLRAQGRSDAEERWRRALGVVGAFHSGRSDISKEHDRELTEAYRS